MRPVDDYSVPLLKMDGLLWDLRFATSEENYQEVVRLAEMFLCIVEDLKNRYIEKIKDEAVDDDT